MVENGISIKQFWGRDEDRKRFNLMLREKHKVDNFDTEMIHRDGTTVPITITVAEFSLGDEQFYINWVWDRRPAIKLEEERQVLESKLSQSRKMEAIGQLTGGIAHDFNNILQAILGYCQLARLSPQAQEDSELDSYLEYIEHGGERAQDMIRQLMIFSRSSPQKSSMQALDTLVNNVLRLLKPSISSEIEIRAQLPQGLPEVMIDPVQFEQIVMNLCLNARDAIEGNGLINVSLENVDVSGAVCNSCHEFIYGRYVELVVEDTGQRIDAVHFNSIFDPFYSTKEVGSGTGLGLSTVHGTVHNFGGHIRVFSTPGKGTTFKLLFPLNTREEHQHLIEQKPEKRSVAKTVERKNRTIMVVDDEPDITSFLSKLLDLNGYDTIVANNSYYGLELMGSVDIDLVISDQTMPGLNGVSLAGEIRKIKPECPVIICSGNLSDLEHIPILHPHILAFLSKPIDTRLLLEKISQTLH